MPIVRDRAFVDAPLDAHIPTKALLDDGSFTRAVAVVPSDTVDLSQGSGIPPTPCAAIFVGDAGTINGILAGETTQRSITYTTGWHKVSYRRIFSTGTTAANIRAYW